MVDALISAGTASDVDGQIINVGSGEETAIRDLVALIGEITGQGANVLYNTEAAGGIARLTADVSKAGRLLKYRPKVKLERGLRQMIEEHANYRRMAGGRAAVSPGNRPQSGGDH